MPAKIEDESIMRRIASTLGLRDPHAIRFELLDGVLMVYDISKQEKVLSSVKMEVIYFNAGTIGQKVIKAVPANKRITILGAFVCIEQAPGAGLSNGIVVSDSSGSIYFWVYQPTAAVSFYVKPHNLIMLSPIDEGMQILVNVSEAGDDSMLSYCRLWYLEEVL